MTVRDLIERLQRESPDHAVMFVREARGGERKAYRIDYLEVRALRSSVWGNGNIVALEGEYLTDI